MQKHDESSVFPSEYQYSRKQVESLIGPFLGQYEAHLQKWGVFGLPPKKWGASTVPNYVSDIQSQYHVRFSLVNYCDLVSITTATHSQLILILISY